MNSDRRTGIVVGALFITATVASILGSVALGSLLDGSDYLIGVAGHEGRVVLSVLLFLIAASSAFATAFLLFPILRRHAEGLAAGYVGLRAFENVFYVAGAIGILMMLTVSQSDVVGAGLSNVSLLGVLLLAWHDWSVSIGTLIFAGLGSMTLNYVLYRSLLAPRWLSIWGLIGAGSVFIYGLIGVLGFDTGLGSPLMILAIPLAVQEMVFAGWLIVRGFERRQAQPGHRPEQLVDATI